MVKYKTYLSVVTISGAREFKKLKKEELEPHGKVASVHFGEGDHTRVGVMLWNHDLTFKRDEFVVLIVAAKAGLFKQGRAGLMDLKDFDEKYPSIPMHDIGVFQGAKEVRDAAVAPFEEKESENKVPNQKGLFTQPMRVGVIRYRGKGIKKEGKGILNKILEEMHEHRGKDGIRVNGFPKIGIHVILWHHKQPGKDDYWIIIAMQDKFVGKEARIEEIEKLGVPVIKYGIISKLLKSKDASRITNKLEEKMKKAAKS